MSKKKESNVEVVFTGHVGGQQVQVVCPTWDEVPEEHRAAILAGAGSYLLFNKLGQRFRDAKDRGEEVPEQVDLLEHIHGGRNGKPAKKYLELAELMDSIGQNGEGLEIEELARTLQLAAKKG